MEEDIKKLVHKNLEYNKEILQKLEKIEKHFFWQKIFAVVKIVVIVIPIVLAIIYALPLFEATFNSYQQVLQGLTGSNSSGSLINTLLQR